jgi:hypothetical protein
MSGPLPPRSALPRDVPVPALPGLGLSWYDRGPGYWARRAGMALLWLLLTALVTLITVAVLIGLYHRSLAGFYLVLIIEILLSAGVLALFAVQTARRWNDPEAPSPLFGRPPGAAAGHRRSALAAAGQIALAVSFLSIGLYLALLITALLPETLAERRARLHIAGQLRDRGVTGTGA